MGQPVKITFKDVNITKEQNLYNRNLAYYYSKPVLVFCPHAQIQVVILYQKPILDSCIYDFLYTRALLFILNNNILM